MMDQEQMCLKNREDAFIKTGVQKNWSMMSCSVTFT